MKISIGELEAGNQFENKIKENHTTSTHRRNVAKERVKNTS